jgi:hypothetical protein
MGINGTGPFTSWEQWSNIATVFSVFIASGLIPLSIYLNRKYKSMRDLNIKKNNDNIEKIATEVSNALDNKLDEKIEQQSQAIGTFSESMDKIYEKLDNQDKHNKDILTTLRTLTSDFHNFKDEQLRVNAKVDYIDNIFRNLITFNNTNNNKDNSNSQ